MPATSPERRRILVQIPQALDRLREAFPDVEVVDVAREDPAPGPADVWYGGWGDWDRTLRLVREAGVRWFQLSGTGADGVPRELFDAVETVTCARGASAVPISEYVLATMLAFEKALPDSWLRDAPERWNFQRMDTLAGKTLGLVGIGGIGGRVARLALAFDMAVVALRRRVDAGSPVPGVQVTGTLPDVLGAADHLVLATPATSRTHHLLDDAAFGRVKPGVHVVNIARGALIEQDALRRALDDGRVARASLDTVDPEPLPAGHWMYSHPRVFLTPHSSWSSKAFFRASIDIFVDNLARYLEGRPLEHVVDPEEGY
jgi:phosphoglycerate dehydrogenase-like enzyme